MGVPKRNTSTSGLLVWVWRVGSRGCKLSPSPCPCCERPMTVKSNCGGSIEKGEDRVGLGYGDGDRMRE